MLFLHVVWKPRVIIFFTFCKIICSLINTFLILLRLMTMDDCRLWKNSLFPRMMWHNSGEYRPWLCVQENFYQIHYSVSKIEKKRQCAVISSSPFNCFGARSADIFRYHSQDNSIEHRFWGQSFTAKASGHITSKLRFSFDHLT